MKALEILSLLLFVLQFYGSERVPTKAIPIQYEFNSLIHSGLGVRLGEGVITALHIVRKYSGGNIDVANIKIRNLNIKTYPSIDLAIIGTAEIPSAREYPEVGEIVDVHLLDKVIGHRVRKYDGFETGSLLILDGLTNPGDSGAPVYYKESLIGIVGGSGMRTNQTRVILLKGDVLADTKGVSVFHGLTLPVGMSDPSQKSDDVSRFWNGYAFYVKKKYSEARSVWDVLSSKTKYTDMELMIIGEALFVMGLDEESFDVLKVIADNSGYVNALNKVANYYWRKKNPDRAFSYWKKASGYSLAARYNMSYYYFLKSQNEQGVRNLKEIISYCPEFNEAVESLSMYYMSNGTNSGIEYFNNIYEEHASCSSSIHMALVVLYEKEGDHEQAIRHNKLAFTKNRFNEKAAYLLGLESLRVNDFDELTKVIESLLDLESSYAMELKSSRKYAYLLGLREAEDRQSLPQVTPVVPEN